MFGCGLYSTKSRLACMRGLQAQTVVGQVGAEGQVLPQLFYNADVQYLALMASVTSGCFGLEGTSKNQLVQAPLPWLASVSVSFFQVEFHYIAVVKRVHLMLTPCPAKLPFAVKQPALCEQGKLLTWCGCLPASGTDLASHPLARKCAGSTSSQCCPVAQKYTVSTSAFLVASCLTTACSKFSIPFILAHVKPLLLYFIVYDIALSIFEQFLQLFSWFYIDSISVTTPK